MISGFKTYNIWSIKYKSPFNKLKITVMIDAKTGSRLNHSWDVAMDESIGKKLLFLLILIWSQKIDKG